MSYFITLFLLCLLFSLLPRIIERIRFKDNRMKGNYRKATEEYINLLLEVLEIEPEKYGYEFGRWTTARLAIYLGDQTGIELSSTQVRRILKAKKYVYLAR